LSRLSTTFCVPLSSTPMTVSVHCMELLGMAAAHASSATRLPHGMDEHHAVLQHER
jgi:hypothetical protein